MPALLHETDASRDPFQAVLDAVHSHEFDDQLPEAHCGGCSRLIDEESVEQGVIKFAAKLWHVECFRCAECNRQVSTDRGDTLLLSDGHPICGECNYSCNICGLPITEEALMTGNESYHAACFTCRSCNSRIVDLVFAKTSHGIYCMKCHNERVARSRRHAEQKRTRARTEKQLRDAAASEHKSASLLSPSANTTASNDTPPAVPAKEALASHDTTLTASSDSPASLSPWNSKFSSSISRPGSSASKRPINAPPPPPAREDRTKLAASRRQAFDSRSSESSITSRTRDQGSSGYDTPRLSPSPQKTEFGPSPDSHSPIPVSPLSDSFHAADRLSEPTISMPPKILTGLSVSQFDLGSDASQNARQVPLLSESQEEPGSRRSSTDANKSTSLRRPFLASSSSTRLSRAYSFYDPDILNLMESLGRSVSNNELLPTRVPSTRKTANSTTVDRPLPASPSSLSPLPTSPMSTSPLPSGSLPTSPLPISPNTEAGDFTRLAYMDDVEEAGDIEAKSEQEGPSEERKSTFGSLRSLSSKMRASMRGAKDGHVSMNLSFVEEVLHNLEETRKRMETLQFKYNRIRRASQQAAQGFSMAREEFHQEVDARHEAETEMVRLKQQLADHALKLATINNVERETKQLETRSNDIKVSLRGMERDLAKLVAERDMTVAEVAELVSHQDGTQARSSVSGNSASEATLAESLASRLEAIKGRYRKEIDDLAMERDALLIEIEELKQSKELCVEEAHFLNTKIETLNAIFAQLRRKNNVATQSRDQLPPLPPLDKELPPQQGQSTSTGGSVQTSRQAQNDAMGRSSFSSRDVLPGSAGLDSASLDSVAVQRMTKQEKIEPAPVVKMFKWMKPKLSEATRINFPPSSQAANGLSLPAKVGSSAGGAANALTRATSHDIVVREHLFQPYNVLRPTRCLACQKNMWGQSEMRCALCTHVCHTRCLQNLPFSCIQPYVRPEDNLTEPSGPSMFGKDLVEQAMHESRDVPLIVDKCIKAVAASGMDYEGIYRKSGGTSQLKVIMQLFDRGSDFDLQDLDRFNDVSAVTSVLKNYFRELPIPLLTFDLHDEFINAVQSKQEPPAKANHMTKLVSMLPKQHYCTLKALVMHLYQVQERSDENRMNARNLGVVFGPTLMRSNDPTQEFAHMGGKALTIEYFIDHAFELFA